MVKGLVGLNSKNDKVKEMNNRPEIKSISKNDIAIIGMDVKLSNAEDATEFWNAIQNSFDMIREFPEERKKDVKMYMKFKNIDTELSFKEAGYLNEIDKFDYSFFGISPKEASLINPQQRIFLETAYKAVEDAGYGGDTLNNSKTGIYLGINSLGVSKYQELISEIEPSSMSLAFTGNVPSIIASRIAYFMNFKGPSMIIDTACSSSLVAVHLACKAIRYGECDCAIAGGIALSHARLNEGQQIGIESSDGRTRTFDDSSDGCGGGEGVAAIVLKPYHKALEDRDSIYAVIKGSAINQDGSTINIASPNPVSQGEVIKSAWADAKIDPTTITYIEAHGTGTRIGDPIEIEGIKRAFSSVTSEKQFCAIGSVKSNIGHLDGAAGIVGLVKTVLCLKNKKIVPSIHFDRPNAMIDFLESPVYVNTKLRKWETKGFPRRCGVSSFGISGTNCHIVLEEHIDSNELKNTVKEPCIFVLSSKSIEALRRQVDKFISMLEKEPDLDLRDICYTLSTGRGHHNYRLAMVIDNIQDLVHKLKDFKKCNLEQLDVTGVFFGVCNNTEVSYSLDSMESLSNQVGSKQIYLEELGRLYTMGTKIDWKKLYKFEERKRVSLPTYSFDKKRCWLQIPTIEKKIQDKADEMFFTVGWQKKERSLKKVDFNNRVVMVLKDENEVGSELIKHLMKSNVKVIEVNFGESFNKVNENMYTVDNTEKGFEMLFNYIREENITDIIHMATMISNQDLDNVNSVEDSQNRGVYSLFNMTKSLVDLNFRQKIKITLVAEYVNEVTGEEKRLNPQHSTIFGLGKVINQEHVNLSCKCFDIDEYINVEALISEIGEDSNGYISAFRNDQLFIEELKRCSSKELISTPIEIKKDGVYVITGGTGGMGLEFAKYLAMSNSVNIVLIGRSELPESSEWNKIIQEGKEKKLCEKLKQIIEIEKMDSHVHYLRGDIGELNEVESIFKDLKDRFGKINGIIHAAGMGGHGFIYKESLDQFKEIVKPKVHGTWMLDSLTKEEPIDFFVMCSSLTAILGASGHGDYTAANSFLDTFAAYRRKLGKRTVAINWTRWRETGMAVEYGINEIDGILKSMSTNKAIYGFKKVINSDIKRVVIGELNHEILAQGEKRDYFIENAPIKLSKELLSEICSRDTVDKFDFDNEKLNTNEMKHKPRIRLIGKELNENYSEIEIKISEIWREVLGFDEFNIHDNFFEIGGNSVMLVRIHSLIEMEYPGKISITDLFAYTTIHKLAQFISTGEEMYPLKIKDECIEDDINKLFDGIDSGEISIDEAIEKYNSIEV